MKKVRRFSQDDWDGFAGAERFKDGSNPFIVENDNFYAVGDVTGISLWFVDEDDDCWNLNLDNPAPKLISTILESLPEIPSVKDLKALGFGRG